jgi:hypothetical protein
MKAQGVSAVFICLVFNQFLFSQTTLLDEDFTTVSGIIPPVGWTVQTVQGYPDVDAWHFENPGRRVPNPSIASKFACYGSDRFSDNNQAEEVYLTSLAFNATKADDISLEFDQCFLGGDGGDCTIEVYSGTSWMSIYTNNVTTDNPRHSNFNITPQVQNKSNAQIRFKWTGNYSWYWIIDNFKVIVQSDGINQFTDMNSSFGTGGYYGVVTWADFNNDDRLDILCGTKIYKNNQVKLNTPPATPPYISAYLLDKKLILKWSISTDNETQQLGLTYNLRIGTTPGR